MEKITINENVDYWITSDGMRHRTENQAIQFQNYLDDGRISGKLTKQKFIDFIEIGGLFTFIANQEQLDYFNRKYRLSDGNFHWLNDHGSNKNNKLIIGDWLISKEFYDSDSDNGETTTKVYTLQYLLHMMKSFIEDAETKTVDGQF